MVQITYFCKFCKNKWPCNCYQGLCQGPGRDLCKHTAFLHKLISSVIRSCMKIYLSLTGPASLVAQLVKNLPAAQETQVWFLGWEDPLEKEWQPTPVFLPGESHGQRTLTGYCPSGSKSRTWLSNYTTTTISLDGRMQAFPSLITKCWGMTGTSSQLCCLVFLWLGDLASVEFHFFTFSPLCSRW